MAGLAGNNIKKNITLQNLRVRETLQTCARIILREGMTPSNLLASLSKAVEKQKRSKKRKTKKGNLKSEDHVSLICKTWRSIDSIGIVGSWERETKNEINYLSNCSEFAKKEFLRLMIKEIGSTNIYERLRASLRKNSTTKQAHQNSLKKFINCRKKSEVLEEENE